MLSGVGLDFYVANTRVEVFHSEKHVKFEEELQAFLLEKEGYPAKSFGLLLNLDQYKDRVFSAREVEELVLICEELLQEYDIHTERQWEVNERIRGINAFAKELKALCLNALDNSKKVIALGD